MGAWRVTTGDGEGLPFGPGAVSTAELADDGTITAWGPSARRLLGYDAAQAIGLRANRLLADGVHVEGLVSRWCRDGDTGELALRHHEGHTVRVRARVNEMRDADGELRWMVTALPSAEAVRRDVGRSVLAGLADRTSIGLAVLDTDLRYVWINPALERMGGVPAGARYGRRIDDVLPRPASRNVMGVMKEVMRTGRPVNDFEYHGLTDASPDREVALSFSCFRLEDSANRVAGVGYAVIDVTPRFRARERLKLLDEASARIGSTLDAVRVAGGLVAVAVPRFAASAAVDLLDAVVTPTPSADDAPAPRALRTVADSPPPANGGGPLLLIPLRAGGRNLGQVRFLGRAGQPFEPDDITLAQELAQRVATCVDNASRFERERTAALALRRSLLPKDVPRQTAVDVARRYLPAAQSQVGGAWYDVIPLSGARTALVVGQVAGHGLAAAAGMGRLRTAVQTLARMDLPPGELLAHLDDIVVGLHEESNDTDTDPGGTCLYAVYDPVAQRVSLASAGHPPPAVALPDGTSRFLESRTGPALGLGAGLPFETAEFPLPEGGLLALYSAALPAADGGREGLRRALAAGEGSPDEVCGALTGGLPRVPGKDDAVVLVARARGVPEDRVAVWDVPLEPSAVARVRADVAGRMARWGLRDQSFPTELVASELVTNAIRYGRPPVRLRLIRETSLTCEVFDASDTTPHVRRAAADEEGGRGLFLVAQLTERWGTRYTAEGKTVWSEQPLSTPDDTADTPDAPNGPNAADPPGAPDADAPEADGRDGEGRDSDGRDGDDRRTGADGRPFAGVPPSPGDGTRGAA
jgi:PAS domain-containing protein